ncbi:MAG: FeoB-associated Cys-rich membrane protein [bacterium]
MTLIDYILMAAILGGAFYLLYRSFRKRGGACAGCSNGLCNRKP